VSVAAFIADQRRIHGVPHAIGCRALGVSESWFYKWKDRPPGRRQLRRRALTKRIIKSFRRSRGTYGSPRVHHDLAVAGWRVSVNTIAKIMAELGLAGRRPLRRRRGLTRAGRSGYARDLVGRCFDAVAPNVLWCGDLTEIATSEGKVYCATVIDMFSRKALGHAFSTHHDAELVIAALRQAATRRGGSVDGVIFHSDRGGEYCGNAFADCCTRLGVIQSMGRTGSALDNACAESFNSIIKVEYIHREDFPTIDAAVKGTTEWITEFYNPIRRHSSNGGLAPTEFEQHMARVRGTPIT
jgi:transposase InsO family protein